MKPIATKMSKKNKEMKRNLIFIIFLLATTIGFSQTTVTLQDQCNCEVLSGVDVSAPGATTPTGADTGDIYVNTTSGTIFFWDGDSWELTSTDSQQILDFSYDIATRGLTLELENGGAPITVTLPADTLTQLTLGVDGNSLDYEDENGLTTNIPLNVGDLTFNAVSRELIYTNEEGISNSIALPFDTLTTIALNGDNTNIDYIDENGVTTQIDLTTAVQNLETLTTIVDNGDGTLTYNNEAGNTQTIDTNASSNPYDNTTSGLAATDVQAAIDEINAAAGTVALVYNGDGTYDFTDSSGTTTVISDTSISTLSAPVNGVYTYTDEAGTCLLYTSPSPRDRQKSRMPSSA